MTTYSTLSRMLQVSSLINARPVFTWIFLPLMIIVGEFIHYYGRKVLSHAFGEAGAVSYAVTMLLRFGWYLIAVGLLLWNLGIKESDDADVFASVSLRLGITLFVLGFLHGINILAVSIFQRKQSG
jgi:hypothetical protein